MYVYIISSRGKTSSFSRDYLREISKTKLFTRYLFSLVRAKEGETSMHRDKVAIRRNVAGKSGSKRSVRRSGQVMAKNAG